MCAATMKFVVTGLSLSSRSHRGLGRWWPRSSSTRTGRSRASGRVREGERRARRQDLFPRRVALAPERRAPRGVERLERAVPVAEPAAEGVGGDVAVAVRVLAAELVRDVPELDRGVVAVALGRGAHQPGRARGRPGSSGRTPGGRRASGVPSATTGRPRGGRCQPRRGRGGPGAEVDADAGAVQQFDDRGRAR